MTLYSYGSRTYGLPNIVHTCLQGMNMYARMPMTWCHHGDNLVIFFRNCLVVQPADTAALQGKGLQWLFVSTKELVGVALTVRCGIVTHSCLPGLREPASISRSNSVRMSFRAPSSPNAPHSMFTHMRPSSPSTSSKCRISSM